MYGFTFVCMYEYIYRYVCVNISISVFWYVEVYVLCLYVSSYTCVNVRIYVYMYGDMHFFYIHVSLHHYNCSKLNTIKMTRMDNLYFTISCPFLYVSNFRELIIRCSIFIHRTGSLLHSVYGNM